MNRQKYRAAFDAIPFDEDFQHKTVWLLRERIGQKPESEKECLSVRKKRISVVAVALAALFIVSAMAVVMTLSPKEVAERIGEPTLGKAFESEDAILVNETRTVGEYEVTFMGMVSGTGLSDWEIKCPDIVQNSTYTVLSYARTDGTPITDDTPEITVTLLREDFAPWGWNSWILGASVTTFVEDGRLYFLHECNNIEYLANHTIYLAVGKFIAPTEEVFAYDWETDTISYQPGQEGTLFVLPLDPAKANPRA